MIAAKDLEPFLTRPLVLDPDSIARSPRIVATADSRVALFADDTAYATGIDRSKGAYWNLYRPGRIFLDPDTGQELGSEAIYLGDAEIASFGEILSCTQLAAIFEESGIPSKTVDARTVIRTDNRFGEAAGGFGDRFGGRFQR